MDFRKLKRKLNYIKKIFFNISKESLDDENKINNDEDIKMTVESLINTIKIESIFDNLSNIKKPINWAAIRYYEKNNLIGEFISNEKIIIVDNNLKSSIENNKFCIANLKSNLTTNENIINTKKLIGNGIKFCFDGNNVIIVNNSTTNLFIHSLSINKYYSRPDNTIQRVPPNNTAVVFRKSIFQQLLFDYLQKNNNQSTRDLYTMCKIRISLKTGRNLGNSSVIPDLPCWLELQLHIPRGILDCVVSKKYSR